MSLSERFLISYVTSRTFLAGLLSKPFLSSVQAADFTVISACLSKIIGVPNLGSLLFFFSSFCSVLLEDELVSVFEEQPLNTTAPANNVVNNTFVFFHFINSYLYIFLVAFLPCWIAKTSYLKFTS